MLTSEPFLRAAISPRSGAVFVEQMAHHAHAAGLVDEVGFETDQAARRDERFDADLRCR